MNTISDHEMRTNVYSICKYHKYWIAPDVVNPAADSVTRAILDLKYEAWIKHSSAVRYFSKLLTDALEYLNANQIPNVAVVVPSHQAGRTSLGLISVLNNVSNKFGFLVFPDCLNRAKTIQKMTAGGQRNIFVHLNSIRINHRFNVIEL